MAEGLAVRGLSVNYGGVKALSGVDLEVRPGELVGLIGPNGAGKTTLIDAVTGFTGCDGSVSLGGRPLDRTVPSARARLGLARTWQAGELFEDLTVHENLAIAADRRSAWHLGWDALVGRTSDPDGVAEALALLELEPFARSSAAALTHGQRKLVGVARALACRPTVVCLDEPAAGLDTKESEQLGSHLRHVVEGGTGMLLVDHDMGLVLGVCDRIVVLEFGEVIARGTPAEIRRDRRVIDAYLGAVGDPVAPSGGSS